MNRILMLLSLTSTLSLQLKAQTASSATIDCFIGDAKPTDTIHLQVWNDNLSERSATNIPTRNLIGINGHNSYKFTIEDITHPVYFSLVKDVDSTFGSYLSFMPYYLLEPGDHLQIRMDSLRPKYVRFYGDTIDNLIGYRLVGVHITGKGSGKAAFTSRLDSSTSQWLQTSYTRKQPMSTRPAAKYDSAYYATLPDLTDRVYQDNKAILDHQLQLLEADKPNMSEIAYRITRVNLIGTIEAADVRLFSLIMPGKGDPNVSDSFRHTLADRFRAAYDHREKTPISDAEQSILPLSKDYINFQTEYAYYLAPKGKEYDYLKDNFKGVLRDKLITDFLLKDFFYLKNSQEVLKDAVTTVGSDFSAKQIGRLYDKQSVGSTAYNFALPDTKGNIRQLSDLRGKIVFVDLWYTGCGACAKFYHYQLSRVEERYKDSADVAFVTISIDKTKATWLKSVESGAYTSNDNEKVVNLYTGGRGIEDPLIKAYNVTGYPHPFMIDRNGKIYRVNRLQAAAEDLFPIIDEAIAKDRSSIKKQLPKSTLKNNIL